MIMDRNTQDHDAKDHDAKGDARLNAAMAGWQAPALPPGFTARVAARITQQQAAEQQARGAALLPWSPLKLSAATAAAVMVGLALGVTAPVVETRDTLDTIDTAELTSIDTVGATLATLTATADSDEIIEHLW